MWVETKFVTTVNLNKVMAITLSDAEPLHRVVCLDEKRAVSAVLWNGTKTECETALGGIQSALCGGLTYLDLPKYMEMFR